MLIFVSITVEAAPVGWKFASVNTEETSIGSVDVTTISAVAVTVPVPRVRTIVKSLLVHGVVALAAYERLKSLPSVPVGKVISSAPTKFKSSSDVNVA